MEKRLALVVLLLSTGVYSLLGDELRQVPEPVDASTVRIWLTCVERKDEIAGTSYAYLA